jgi:hypothetical protein
MILPGLAGREVSAVHFNPSLFMDKQDIPAFNPAQQNHDLALKIAEILAGAPESGKLTDKQIYDRTTEFLSHYMKANAVIDNMFESVLNKARSDMHPICSPIENAAITDVSGLR